MLCGIDETGRGPLAGPLVVAGVVLLDEIAGLKDSKVLSEKKREKLFDEIKEKSKFHIVFSDAKTIDEKGISACLKNSILEIMENLKEFSNEFLMDGNTSFGISTLQHKIKADATIKEVSAASILAKVSRDRFMDEISNQYPNYDFHKHKGYGTKAHVEAIKKFGRSDLHRFSFKLKALGEDVSSLYIKNEKKYYDEVSFCENFKIVDKDSINPVFSVTGIAEIMAKIIDLQPSDSGTMIGIFGKWGRGKTYLYRKIKNYILDNKTNKKYEFVEFSAWKYQDTKESWAYLYETLLNSYLLDSPNLKKIKMFKLLNINKIKYGYLPFISFSFPFFIYLIWQFCVNKLEVLDFLISGMGIFLIIKLILIYKNFNNGAIKLYSKYFSKKSFNDILGLQAEVQKELIFLLKAWISENENKKIILFVDDLDRCEISQVLSTLDGLRVMLDDKSIYDRLIIITAIDEKIIENAINYKYTFSKEENKEIYKGYLEKIFLIGIKLNELNNNEAREFLNNIIPKINEEKNQLLLYKKYQDIQEDDIQEDDIQEDDIQEIGDKIEESNDYEISEKEKQYLLEKVKDIKNPTPRNIRIFYYKYMLFKKLLELKFKEENLTIEWTNLEKKHILIIDVIIDNLDMESFNNFSISDKLKKEIENISKMVSIL